MTFPEVISQMIIKNNKVKTMDYMGIDQYISDQNKQKTIRKYMNQTYKMNQTNNTVINMLNNKILKAINMKKREETATKYINNKMVKTASREHPNTKINKKTKKTSINTQILAKNDLKIKVVK